MEWVLWVNEDTKLEADNSPRWLLAAPDVWRAGQQATIMWDDGWLTYDVVPCPEGCAPFPPHDECPEPFFHVNAVRGSIDAPEATAICPSGHIWSLNPRQVR